LRLTVVNYDAAGVCIVKSAERDGRFVTNFFADGQLVCQAQLHQLERVLSAVNEMIITVLTPQYSLPGVLEKVGGPRFSRTVVEMLA
jgi:hypothetical protein